MYFTDANKTLKAGYTGPTTKIWQSTLASVQQRLLLPYYRVFSVGLNIVSDSQYAVRITQIFETITLPRSSSKSSIIMQYYLNYKI